MGKKDENTSFTCRNCGSEVLAVAKGGYRNHCPFCLCSLHVDDLPGDRTSDCLGLMRAVAVRSHSQKGLQILHKCEACGFTRYNMVSDDVCQPDDMRVVLELMKNPRI